MRTPRAVFVAIVLSAAAMLSGAAPADGADTTAPDTASNVSGTIAEMTATVYDWPHKETVWAGEITSDDPRLQGSLARSENRVWFKKGVNISLHSSVWELTPASGGRWLGAATMLGTIDGPGHIAAETVVLTGTGPLDGLSAYLIVDWTQDPVIYGGAIFPGSMPEVPEPCPASRHSGEGDRPCPVQT